LPRADLRSSQEDHMSAIKPISVGFLLAAFVVWLGHPVSSASRGTKSKGHDSAMSAMGRAAARARARIELAARGGVSDKEFEDAGVCVNQPECEGDEHEPLQDGPSSTQSETSIAVDRTGQHIVIGFNDFRGFNTTPLSISGFMYSDDGGEHFVDGGQLPSPGVDTVGTTRLPQVFGDPDVKYVGDCTFIYSSIVLAKFSATQVVETMGVHRSTDCGHTWTGPFIVTPATNPSGKVDVNGSPQDAADKELMDVDPDTGRVALSWTNFTSTAAEISVTYSDNITAATPTWSPRQIVGNTPADGQASVPRFAGHGSQKAYVAWWRIFDDLTNQVAFARSTDNGATWSPAVELAPTPFFFIDHILGNDRVHMFPSLAVDNSHSRSSGNVYVVYANNDSGDGADIAFQRSTDDGLTFSRPLLLNSRPGFDRAQWFPWVTVDSSTGRVHVFYYDQGVASSGDLTQVTHTFSDDGGVSWKQPMPLNARPFHAGWGNDTGQPNLGDYNQAVAQQSDLFAVFAEALRPPAGFVDGQPTSASMTVPDVTFMRLTEEHHKFKAASLDLGEVTFVDSGGNGNIDPNEFVTLTIPLRNYVTNALNAAKVRGINASLTTSTPGVVVVDGDSHYKNIEPGDTRNNDDAFVLKIGSSFVAGTPLELALDIDSAEHGGTTLLFTLFTGTPQTTTLLSENFNGVAPGALPAGWTAAHGGGANIVRWTTGNTFCGATSNAAFHTNAADGPGPGPFTNTRWERLLSPAFVVPANADYVTIEMDVCTDTEDDPNFNILAYDGFFLRVTDLTPGRLLRSVLAEAFADQFTTGSLFHYPKHLPRGVSAAYFEDMSVWAGDSHGSRHVRLRLPGMAGSTAQLRFEFTQDAIGTCADVRPGHTCGVSVDNVVVTSVVPVAP
jgi:hypothetical protein